MTASRPRLIVDTDGGVDDALALLQLAAAGRPPDLVTVVFGNVDLETAARNVRAVLEAAGIHPEVHLGADRPLVAPRFDARHIHGDDGLGGAPVAEPHRPHASRDAAGVLVAEFRRGAAAGEPLDLLTLGPLTNVALALRLDPESAAGVGRLVVMGGTCFGRGNTTPAAEFNVLADAEAAAVVLSAGLPTELVPWEVCLDNPVSGAQIDRDLAAAPPGPVRDLVGGLAASGRALRQRLGGGDEFVMPDPLAAAVLLDRSVVARSVSASVAVELAGTVTRGMTVVDPGGRLGTPPIEVVESVHPHVFDGFFGRILAPAWVG